MFTRTLARTALRSVRPSAPAVARAALARPAPLFAAAVRPFSSSLARFEPSALSTKLEEELNFETQEGSFGQDEPEFLKAFREEGVWQVEDIQGSDEVTLRRTFGNENIRLIFSISDIDAENETTAADYEQVDAEAASPDSGSGGVGEEAPAAEPGFPVETSITITKPSGGALTIDALAQDGLFIINNIAFYPDQDVALGMTSEDDWKRQGLYMGPAFENLDESVQAEFEQYLEERGVNSALALFIPDLAEWKEQKEYVRWLEGTKEFIEKEK
ncbi:hypothetical protein JCM11251_003650 [Rhodosporidiobolus azoricus]